MELSALRDFVAVVRSGSFANAATETGVPRSTLSKRVQMLEEDLGVRLIERNTRKLRLTADGELLLERASPLVEEATELEHMMRDRNAQPQGRLRVSVPVLMGNTTIAAVAAEYSRRWPKTRLEIVLSDQRVDMIEEGYDCAIRVGALNDASVIARQFATGRSLVVARPEIAGRLGSEPHPSMLAGLAAIAYVGGPEPRSWTLMRGKEQVTVEPDFRLALSGVQAVYQAARAGAGFALVPEFVARQSIARGELVHVLPQWMTAPADISIIYPSRRHLSARLRAFIDLVVESHRDSGTSR